MHYSKNAFQQISSWMTANLLTLKPKHFFLVNLAQIRSAVPVVYLIHIQNEKLMTDSAKNRTLLACGN